MNNEKEVPLLSSGAKNLILRRPRESRDMFRTVGLRCYLFGLLTLTMMLSIALAVGLASAGSESEDIEPDGEPDYHKEAPSQIMFEGNLEDRGTLLTTMEEMSPHFVLWDTSGGIVVTNVPEASHPSPSSVVIDDFENLRKRLDGYFLEESSSDIESFEGIMQEMLKKYDPQWKYRSVLVVAINKGEMVQVYATLWDTGWSLAPVIESRSRPLTIAEALATIIAKEGKESHEDGWGEPLGPPEEANLDQ